MTLKKHIETVHNDGRYRCDQCYNVCKTSMTIQKHIMKLHSKNVSQCDQCEYVPTTGSDLNNHMTCRGRSMPGEVGWKRIYCHILRGRLGGCGKNLLSKDWQMCKQCGHIFKNDMSLKKHIEMVHNNGLYSCDQCYKVWKTNMTLQ